MENAVQKDLFATSDPFENLLMRASAGTGKTFQLTNRYLGLLSDGRECSKILASTFTRKAAGEIVDRVVERLADAAVDAEDCSALAKHLEGRATLNVSTAQAMLGELLKQLHRVRISTLDSFFSRLARTFSLELGLPPGWSVVDEITDAALRDDAIEALLAEETAEQILHLLAKGEAQRSVSQLARDTIRELYSVYRVTDETAWQVVKRRKLADERTIAQACERLASQSFDKNQLNKGVQEDLARFATGDLGKFLDTGIAKAIVNGSEKYSRVMIPASLMDDYRPLIEFAGDSLINQLVTHTEGTFKLLQAFDRHYEYRKRQLGAFRFEDVTTAVSRSVVDHSYDRFAFRNDDDIDHLLLDEFQDTSPDQWAVIRRFAERTVEPETQRSFFCVGDVKQAIYGWRGGEAEIFEAVSEQLDGIKDAEPLNHSRRSAPVVIETVNKVFQGMHRHSNLGDLESPVRRWCDQYETHTAESKASGWVCLEAASEPDRVLERAVERIKEVHQAAPDATIGVLTRKNATVNRLIYLLGRHGVPASEEGGNPLTDSAAVNVILSLLHWIDHPGDTTSLFHVASTSLGTHLKLPTTARRLLEFNASDLGRSTADRLRQDLLTKGYEAVCLDYSIQLRQHCGARERLRLGQLVDLAAIWNDRITLRPTDFIRYVETQRVAEPSSASVRVMTVHQSKGLEFDFVVLPELEGTLTGGTPNLISHRPAAGERPDGVIRYANQRVRPLLAKSVQGWFDQYQSRVVSESLCVLYVALTRAKRALLMIVEPKESEKSLPKKFQALLRAALSEGDPAVPDQIIYQAGDRNWHQSLQATDAESENEATLDSDQPLAAIADLRDSFPIRTAKKRIARGADLVSPSSLEGGAKTALGSILQPTVSGGLEFGTVIHRLFEMIQWIEDGVPNESALKSAVESLGHLSIAPSESEQGEFVDRAIDYFKRSLQCPVIREAMAKSVRVDVKEWPELGSLEPSLQTSPPELEVRNERDFVVRDGQQLLRGTIDRLVEYWSGDRRIAAEIIDYKTDRSDGSPGFLEKRIEYYRPQIESYRRAVATWTGLEPGRIRARLLFVDPDSPAQIEI